MLQIREEATFTKGRIIVRGNLVTRGQAKRADDILCFKPNIPLALIEAKDNSHSVGDSIRQCLDYATTLDIEATRDRLAASPAATLIPRPSATTPASRLTHCPRSPCARTRSSNRARPSQPC